MRITFTSASPTTNVIGRIVARFALTLAAALAVALHAHAADGRAGIVVDSEAVGRIRPQLDSPERYRYALHQRVEILGAFNLKDGGRFLHTAPKTMHYKAGGIERIPALWVQDAHIVLFDEMRPFSGCWPYRYIKFRDGVVDVDITLGRDGRGFMEQSEYRGRVKIRVFRSGQVIAIKNLKGAELFTLFIDDQSQLEMPNTPVEVRSRECS
jgi:hypothetical protein